MSQVLERILEVFDRLAISHLDGVVPEKQFSGVLKTRFRLEYVRGFIELLISKGRLCRPSPGTLVLPKKVQQP